MQKLLLTVPFLALGALGWTQVRHRPLVELGEAALLLEWTPGQEAVLRLVVECEHELERVQVLRPDGRELIALDARHCVPNGLRSVELELREPDLDRLLASYEEGEYRIAATTVGGSLALGGAELSHALPAAAHILHPVPGQLAHPTELVVVWAGDRNAAGYEVELEQEDGDDANEVKVKLPPEQSSLQVPGGFLAPATETTVEVATIGPNGNRTVSELVFVTPP
jgi:hypothetical protein